MRTKAVVAALIIMGLSSGASAQSGAILRDVQVIQVEPTVVPDPDKVKDASAAGLVEESLRNALARFDIASGESPIRARIVLEEFTGGSAMKRFMVGFGAGRSTLDGRLRIEDADGRELANVRLRVRGNLLFSSYQDNDQQARQATSEFDEKLIEEIAKLRGRGPTPPAAQAAAPAASKPPAPAAAKPAPTDPPRVNVPAMTKPTPTVPEAAAPAPSSGTAPPTQASPPPAEGAPGPSIEGLSPQQIIERLGKPQYVLEGRDGVATWFYEIDGKPVRVFLFENLASLKRQK